MATILVVDDRPENIELLETLLGYAGHRILRAVDGEDALAAARAERPDLIITDLLMPTMDGFEFVRQLRTEPPLADVRVIFYTATYLETDARALADACGVKHILTKPAEPEVVLQLVGQVLGTDDPVPPATMRSEEFQSEHLRLLSMTLARKAEVVVPQLTAIIELNVQLASEFDPSRLLELFCGGVRRILGAKYALVSIVRKVHAEDRQMFSSGLDRATSLQLPAVCAARGRLARLITDRQAFTATSDAESVGLPAGLPEARSFLAAVVHSPGTVYGWICLAERLGGGDFSEDEVHLAAILGGLVGRIYENGSLYATTRRHAEDLARSEQRFRQLAENIPEVFWVADVEPFQIIYISPAYESVWGRSAASLYERSASWMDSVVVEDQAVVSAHFERSLQGEHTSQEYRIRRPDGSVRWIWDRGFPVRNATGDLERVTGIAEDITERKSAEQQLRQSQKMEAVGRLAGGVAHDFNNLLGVIMGYSESALRTLPPDHPSRTKIEQVLKATDRAAGVTRQLLTFSRKQVAVPRVLDLNGVVSELEKMLRTLIGEDVELVATCGPELGRIKADTGEIEQVIMNLAVNARDAMPSGGRLTIETGNEHLDAGFVRKHPDVPAGAYVRLVVRDTGTGIPLALQANVFEPFFTTKEVGKGTGLGLSTVYGIVKQSGGYILLESEPGHGTAFTIYFPRVPDSADLVQAAPATSIPRGTETILLIEDEDLLRDVTQEMLEACGYAVLTAATGEVALEIAESHKRPIHLVISDVIMPGMSGREVVATLLATRSAIKVLYVSGYTDEALGHHGVLSPGTALLQKPFGAGSLARKVREVLDSR